uniref:Ubiquitin-conjugating enzyme E2-like protein n=1 Tax=Myxobolus cerebralis TaxID=59783 RepID=C1IJE7_9CNID|nr:ubiquitin-conjugating enzyme E2-like protein [Myxobolus cerebralis]
MNHPRNSDILSPSKSKINKGAGHHAGVPSATQRLQQELLKLMNSRNSTISAFPEGENLLKWIATIEGPKDTPYDGFKYRLSFTFPDKYPYNPPLVKFITPCYHPNVDCHGNNCLDILKEEWSALYEVRTILISIQSLLAEPNILSPLNNEAAKLWHDAPAFLKVLREKYEKEARPMFDHI